MNGEPVSKIVMGCHFPKTGGTTLFTHYKKHDPDGAFNYGYHNNAIRFIENRLQFEALPAEQLARIRFLFGHSVYEGLLAVLPHDQIDLVTVYRNPVDHFISRYKHKQRFMHAMGKSISMAEFFETCRNNDISMTLCENFPQLFNMTADPEGATVTGSGILQYDHMVRFLRGFRFLLSTDRLDLHATALNRYLGVPCGMQRRREYREDVELVGVTADDIIAANPIDDAVNRRIVEAGTYLAEDSSCNVFNTFGYDGSLVADVIKQRYARCNRSGIIRAAYRQLFGFFSTDERPRLASFQLQLDYEQAHGIVRDHAEMIAGEMHYALQHEQAGASDQALSKRAYFMGCIHNRNHNQAEAVNAFDRAVALNSKNALAFFELGKIYLKQGMLASAVSFFQQALAINQKMPGFCFYYGQALIATGNQAEGMRFIRKASRMAPENTMFSMYLNHVQDTRDGRFA